MNNDEQNEMRFVLLTQSILADKRLTHAEKLVLARMTGFEEFFEASSTTAEILGTTELVVQRAKRKLTKLGYIEELANTGRGKIYRADLWRLNKKVISDMTKKSYQTLQKSQTENKERINKTLKRDESVAEHGREDINELIELWEHETEIAIKGEANQRRQLYNLIKKHGLDGTKAIIRRVGKMRQAHDRYAPSILKPSDLVGKYSKLDRLLAWEEREKYKKPTPTPTLAFYRRMTPKQIEISDEERAEGMQKFKEAREKLGFTRGANNISE